MQLVQHTMLTLGLVPKLLGCLELMIADKGSGSAEMSAASSELPVRLLSRLGEVDNFFQHHMVC